MDLSDPFLDAVVTRLYRAAEQVGDLSLRELLKNAALSLLRAEPDFAVLQQTLTLTDSLLVTIGALGLLPSPLVEALRDPLPLLLEPRALQRTAAH